MPHLARSFALIALATAALACRRDVEAPRGAEGERGIPRSMRVDHATNEADAGAAAALPGELLPGDQRAFGLLMPVGSSQRFGNDTTRIFDVSAPMPRVMRYLQRRLDILNADIHPLGAMIHRAHVRTSPDGQDMFVDVGVRAQGDHTMVSVWNRTAAELPPRSTEDGLRAAGFDPRTGAPLPGNNN